MKNVWLTTSGDLVDFLEKEIAAGRNPTTPEEWDALLVRMAEAQNAQHLGQTDMSAGYIAGSLRDEGVKAKVLKLDLGEDKDGQRKD